MLALLCSIFISKFSNKFFKYLINNTKYYEHILNTSIIDSLIWLAINYFPLVFSDYLCFIDSYFYKENINLNNNGIVKIVSSVFTTKQQSYILRQKFFGQPPLNRLGLPYSSQRTMDIVYNMAFPDTNLIIKGNKIYHRIKRLEPIVSAMGKKENVDHNIALYDVLKEHIIESKEGLKSIKNDLGGIRIWDDLLDL